MASEKRAARLPRGTPKAGASSSEGPIPIPTVSLPPLIASRPASCFAKVTGCRYGRMKTEQPSSSSEVTPATYARRTTGSMSLRVPTTCSCTQPPS